MIARPFLLEGEAVTKGTQTSAAASGAGKQAGSSTGDK